MGQTLTNEANDKRQLEPLVEALERQAGRRPAEILADAGYCSERNLKYLESEDEPGKRIEAWMATQKTKHNEPPVTPTVHSAREVSLEIEVEFKLLAGGSVNGVPILRIGRSRRSCGWWRANMRWCRGWR